MYPYPLTENVILPPNSNRLLITNLYADREVTVRLPNPYTSRTFEVLLLSRHAIQLHTNSEVFRFLASPPALILRVGGSEKCVGRSLKIVSYETYWRVVATSLPDRNIQFKEIPCLVTPTTN